MRFDGRLLSLAFLVLTLPATTQTPNRSQAVTKTATRTATPAPQATAQLPVTRVSLYKNGVGFFEHAGQVTGDQSVVIDFTSSQLDDVLQSLTAIDLGGGRISGAGYNSTTPLDQQLKTLSIGLDENPTAVDFYNAIRGARVEVTGNGLPITGRILSLEVRPGGTETSGDKKPAAEKRTLTVVSDSGAIRSIDLTATSQVRLLDATLHGDVNRYLEMIDTNRNQGLRHLTLHDAGTGARDLRVSYISEVPIWKSTYRILFTGASGNTPPSATLQGWSVVDNTTGEDWNNVRLSLIAGAPQSFIQPLSTPLYSRRPEIPISEAAQLTPQTHESGDAPMAPTKIPRDIGDSNASARIITGESFGALATGSGGSIGSGSGSAMGGGIAGFTGGGIAPRSYQGAAAASIAPDTTTNAFDDFFEYQIAQPITIRKNESALVPILQNKIDAEPVTLWSATHPISLRALWITNTSNLTLDRGSFSIVEDGNFAGEGLLDPIHPKERRLLSYAADEAVRVARQNNAAPVQIHEFSLADGILQQISLSKRSFDYAVRNASSESRTVVLEHPLSTGWAIDNSSVKPAETTGTVNRYRLTVAAGASTVLHIDESEPNSQSWRLAAVSDAQFNLILRNAKPSPALLALLQPILDAKRAVASLDDQIKTKQTTIDTLVHDQDRLRSNLAALKSTPEERTLATRYTNELNSQEDQLATLRKDLDALKEKRASAAVDLSQKIETARIDEKL